MWMIYTTLVSTDVLESHLDGSWVILDCRFDLQDDTWGLQQYLANHIPGAVYVSLSHDLAGERTGRNGRHPIPPPDRMAATFGRLGIDRTVQVVAYDQDAGMFASRLWWMLQYMGHEAVAVLDGGWAKWLREQRPARVGQETRSAAHFVGAPRPERQITGDEVAGRLGDPAMLLVDARGPDRFEGRTEPIDRIAGHIPGAINHYYRLNVADSDTMLPADALRDRFRTAIGERAPDNVVMYCGSGVSACHNLLAMAHAGLHGSRLYAGSWSEWSADPDRPVETGPGAKRSGAR
jgi:thiosulfate/3-mercaptopyruvate sulfurtransferase